MATTRNFWKSCTQLQGTRAGNMGRSETQKGVRQDHFPEFIETSILVAIVLVILHTIFEELAVIFNWSLGFFEFLDYSGFGFDLLFTVEFLTRSWISRKRKDFRHYFLVERGWVDFLTSVPLLLFVSGPTIVFHLMGGHSSGLAIGFLMILKTAKAIRVTRVLRLIRVVKIFGKIQNAESRMTNRHVGTISTIGVVSLIVALVFSHFFAFSRLGDHNEYLDHRKSDLEALFHAQDSAPFSQIQKYIEASPTARDILSIKDREGNLLFERPAGGAMKRAEAPEIILDTGHRVILSYYIADTENSKVSLLILLSILVLITSYIVIYARIFAQQVSDPIYLMDRGIRQWDFNLEVRIDDDYRDEEIFRLARAFNARWLPLKNRLRILRSKNPEGSEKSVLKMNDFF